MHIGNYFGAVANWVALQNAHRCIFGIVDLHAMTLPYEPQHLRDNTQRMAIDLIACGLDPEKCILFIQSLVPEHTELCWVLACCCPYGDLKRQTQFKDKSSQAKEGGKGDVISAGLFTYPVLQAADILAYRASKVPVGKDQEQHLELSRTVAKAFNARFGDLFPEPQVLLTETPKVASLANPQKKMGKSLGAKHYIGLFESEADIRGKVSSAITATAGTSDSGPGVRNLFEILSACGRAEVRADFERQESAGTIKYSALKDAVADALIQLLGPIQERRRQLQDDKRVFDQVYEMSRAARRVAAETLARVRYLTGLPPTK